MNNRIQNLIEEELGLVSDGFCLDDSLTLTVEQAVRVCGIYATEIREKQIEYCAIRGASYVSCEIRGVGGRIDEDLKKLLIVPRVKVYGE